MIQWTQGFRNGFWAEKLSKMCWWGFRHGVTEKNRKPQKYTKTCGIGLALPECHDTFEGYKCLIQKTLQAVQFCRSALIQFLSRRDGKFRGQFQNSTMSPNQCQTYFFLFLVSLGDLYFIKNPNSCFQREFYPFFISIFYLSTGLG